MEGITTLQAMYRYNQKTHGDKDFIGERVKKEDGTLGMFEFASFN